MNTNYTKWSENTPNVCKIFRMALNISTFSNLTPSKIYPNWYFWFKIKPSGNPAAMHCQRKDKKLTEQRSEPSIQGIHPLSTITKSRNKNIKRKKVGPGKK
jgi:hypothetical protein